MQINKRMIHLDADIRAHGRSIRLKSSPRPGLGIEEISGGWGGGEEDWEVGAGEVATGNRGRG